MQRQPDAPTRRELLGLVGGAGFAGLAGCSALGGGSDEEEEARPEFNVNIIDTNDPIGDGDVLEVTVMVENRGDAEGAQEVRLSVADATDSTQLTLAPGESQEITLTGRLFAEESQQTYDATVKSDDVTDLQRVTVEQAANFELELLDITESITDGETFTIQARVTNSGGVEATTPVTLSVLGADEDPASTQVTLGGGQSTQVTLEWETEDATWANEVTLSTDDDSITRTISVTEPANLSLDVQGNNAPVIEDEEFQVEVLISNSGGADGEMTVTMGTPDRELDSATVTVAGGTEQRVFLTWTPEFEDVGDYQIIVEGGEASQTIDLTVEQALHLRDSQVVQTKEDFAEFISATVENIDSEDRDVVVNGEIDMDQKSIQFQSGLAVNIPAGTYTNNRHITVPAESEREVMIKIPTNSWAFDSTFRFAQSNLDAMYSHSATLDREAKVDDPEPWEMVKLDGVEFGSELNEITLSGEVTNISDEAHDVEVIAFVEVKGESPATASTQLNVLDEEIEEFELTVNFDNTKTTGFWFVEVAGTRDNPGSDPGFTTYGDG